MDRILCLMLSLCLTFFSAPVWAGEAVSERPFFAPISPAESRLPTPSPESPLSSSSSSRSTPTWSLVGLEDTEGQSARDPAEPLSLAEQELENRLAELRIQREAVNVSSPRKARLAGGILLGVGAGIAALAAVTCAAANSGSGTECRQDNATAIEIGGGAVAAIGLVTLIAGISTLGKREEEVRDLDEKIKSLNQNRRQGITNIDARLSLGEEKKLTLSWRF